MGVITFKYCDWEFTSDVETTKAAYARVTQGSADSCKCDPCKNFVQLREDIYPQEIRKLLSDLGIDYRKEPEVSHFAKLENGLHYYSGFFHYKGSFVGKNADIPIPGGTGYNLDLTPIVGTFKLGATLGNSLAFFEDKSDLVQLEFSVEIPWVLDAPEPK